MNYLDRDKYGMYKNSDKAGPGPALMGADTLIGDSVVNAQEEDLGDIKEIMIDTRTGQVAYAVLSFGGFLGLGEKLFAVPWQALHLDTINKRMVLNVDKQRLKSAPGFDPDAWPDMSDVSWVQQIHTFYGTDMSGSMGTGVPMGGVVGGAGTGAGAGMGAAMGGSSTGSGGAGSGMSGTGSGMGDSSSTGSESSSTTSRGTGRDES